jgi:hypothetical protein
MNENIYKIRRSFLIPLVVIVVLLFLLFSISLFDGQRWEIVVLAILFFVSLAVGVENSGRKIIINDQGIKIKKFFRVKEFVWAEITHLGVVVMKKKVYFLLTTTKGFYIISNLLENHALLIRSLVDKLGEDKVEVEVINYLDNPLERLSLIVMSWVAVLVIAAVIILKLSGI